MEQANIARKKIILSGKFHRKNGKLKMARIKARISKRTERQTNKY